MNLEDVFELIDDGKNTEAQTLMKTLSEEARNQPDEVKHEVGGSVVFKRRGKFVVQDEDGNWNLKNPPQRKRKNSNSKL